jgi:beta-galactosidase
VTRNRSAWYVGTQLDAAAMDVLVGRLADESGIAAPLDAPAGVEVVRRDGDGASFLFLLNHGDGDATIELDGSYHDMLDNVDRAGELTLEPFGVAVLRRS